MNPKQRPWTVRELEIMKNQFATMTTKAMAEKLDRSVHAVSVMASKMGLKKDHYGIAWTDSMTDYLKEHFATDFDNDVATKLGVSKRSVIRKARELGLEKSNDFFDVNKDRITRVAVVALRKAQANGAGVATRFQKGVHYNPDGEFKPGRRESPETRAKRIESIKRTYAQERIRLKYGLPQKTKMKLKLKYDLNKYLK